MSKKWIKLGHVGVEDLSPVKTQLHQAVQLLRAIGVAFIEPKSDDSHQNMEWLDEITGMAGNPFGAEKKFRMAVDFANFDLLFLNASGPVVDSLKLKKISINTAVEWTKSILRKYGFDAEELSVSDEFVSLPAGPLVSIEPQYYLEIAAWYANMDAVLRAFASQKNGASAVRCWPHHFDLATLVSFPGEKGKSVGVGLSPGDVYYDQPYLYITPWPFPKMKVENLPVLPAGKYHTHEWKGIVLAASEIVRSQTQEEVITNFIDRGFTIAEELIEK